MSIFYIICVLFTYTGFKGLAFDTTNLGYVTTSTSSRNPTTGTTAGNFATSYAFNDPSVDIPLTTTSRTDANTNASAAYLDLEKTLSRSTEQEVVDSELTTYAPVTHLYSNATVGKLPELWVMHLCHPVLQTSYSVPLAEFVTQLVNNRTDILPGYTMKLAVGVTERAAYVGGVVKTFARLISERPTKVIISGPPFTTESKVIAAAAKFYNLVEVVPSSSSPIMTDPELYPYFTRTRESSALRNPAILSVLKYYKWNKIAILTESVEFISPTVVKMKSLLSENNVTLHSMLTIEDKANRAMRQLKDSTARIFLVYTRHALLIDILCEAYKNKMYGPRFQWLFWSNGTTSINTKLYTDEVTCTIEQLLVTATSMISVVNVPDQNDYKNTVNTDMGYTFAELSKVYTTWLKQLPPSYLADYPLDLLNSTLRTYDVDTLWTVARALHNTDLKLKATGNTSLLDFEYETGSGIAKVLYHEITNLKFYGTTGFISFDKMGDRINNVYITQLTSDMQEKIVGAFNQSIFQLHWSLDNPVTFQGGKPAKDSDTIVYKKLALRPALYWSVLGISVLFLTICGVCLAFNVYYRDVRLELGVGWKKRERLI